MFIYSISSGKSDHSVFDDMFVDIDLCIHFFDLSMLYFLTLLPRQTTAPFRVLFSSLLSIVVISASDASDVVDKEERDEVGMG